MIEEHTPEQPEQPEQEEHEAAEDSEPLSDEERRDLAEKYIVDLLQGMQMAGQAINRLEGYCFALVKIIIDKNIATLEEVESARETLMSHDDIRDYWNPPAEE